MGWQWKEEHLDLILVPLGFSIMCIYHLFLLQIYNKRHTLTAIGYENDNKEAWAEKMLELPNKERGFAATVLNGHLTAASTLSSISLVLCSLIGALLGNSSNFLTDSFILGNASRSTKTIKYIAVSSCFLLAFVCFVQTSRHFVHGSFLLCMPLDKDGEVVKCLRKAVKRGSIFWAFGLRALYFATTLLLWIFGPIPMLVGSVATVVLLYNLDFNKETRKITYEHNHKSEHNTKRNGVGSGRPIDQNGVLTSGTDASIVIQKAVL